MSSVTKRIGSIGEMAIKAEFMKYGVEILDVIGDNASYDFVICVNDRFYKIQVKTTEFDNDGEMCFYIDRSNKWTKLPRAYEKGELDYFALYCVETGWCGLIAFNEMDARYSLIINSHQLNNQIVGTHQPSDYEFEYMMNKYFNLSKLVLINKKVKIRTKEDGNIICPICNKNKMAKRSKMCIECSRNNRSIYKKTHGKDIPSKEELEKLINTMPFTKIGKMYDVTDNAIRKWCKKYDLPYKKKDIVVDRT